MNRLHIARRRLLAAGGLGWLPAMAQDSARPVRLIVAGTAGAAADRVARLLAETLARSSGQAHIVDPRPGAGGLLAVNELAQAPADGQTLLVAVNSLVSEIPHALKAAQELPRRIAPVAKLARAGLVLVGTPTLAPSTLAELIDHARARPGQLNVASYSAGTMSHVLGLLLNRAAGIDLVHVGYKGSTPALADVMGGHVPLMFDALPSALPLLKAGRLKAYAQSTAQRSSLLPAVPTFGELGYPQLEATAWLGLWARPDLPAAIAQRVHEATLRALATPALRETLLAMGFEPGAPRTPVQIVASLQADFERVGATLRAIGFKPE
jgi:tripartite-type tricarboxylate transporter receptor subunit TctC